MPPTHFPQIWSMLGNFMKPRSFIGIALIYVRTISSRWYIIWSTCAGHFHPGPLHLTIVDITAVPLGLTDFTSPGNISPSYVITTYIPMKTSFFYACSHREWPSVAMLSSSESLSAASPIPSSTTLNSSPTMSL